MVNDHTLIDRIVSGVLTQLGGAGARVVPKQVADTPRLEREASSVQTPVTNVMEVPAKVVTAEVLESLSSGVKRVNVAAKAIVTPAAWDVARERGLTIERRTTAVQKKPSAIASPADSPPSALNARLLVIVHHTDAVGRVWEDLQSSWRRDFLGCPDDAAKLAIAEVARGGVSQVVILASQTHRAACLANRHASVKAAAIRDVTDIPVVRQQIRANVWCLDPTGKSWFELKRLFSTLDPRP